MMKIYKSNYKELDSIVMENEQIRTELIPTLGGKIVSLLYKPTGKEWLLDSGARPLKQPVYGSTFTEWDMSGWDECFPTINDCLFDDVGLPDHGEVWSLPWDLQIEDTAIISTVRSPIIPYRFIRKLSFSGQNTLRMDYRVENEGEKPLPFLWVPHPQFSITEPTSIVLPAGMEELLCVYGGYTHHTGRIYPWNEMSVVTPKLNGNGRKFYFKGQVTEGWSELRELTSNNYLRISVSKEQVPYLGIWIDEGMFNDRVACALEPSIGYFDSLQTAIHNGTAQLVQAQGSCEWHLEIALG